jgi:hypothetical protein
VKNFFGKLAQARKKRLDLSTITDATELEGRAADNRETLVRDCKAAQLVATGNKQILIDRLTRYDAGQLLPEDRSKKSRAGKYQPLSVLELKAEIDGRHDDAGDQSSDDEEDPELTDENAKMYETSTLVNAESYVDTLVVKMFDGLKHHGSVQSHDICEETGVTLYHIQFEDGDEEDWNILELLARVGE